MQSFLSVLRICFFLLVLIPFVSAQSITKVQYSPTSPPQKSLRAYVSFVSTDNHMLPGLVLGRSLAKSGSKADFVMMVTSDISKHSVQLLEQAHWRVLQVPFIPNPFWKAPLSAGVGWFNEFEARHENNRRLTVMTKLQVFNLTEYNRIVYLDADTMVRNNPDEMFNCGRDLADDGSHFYNNNDEEDELNPQEDFLLCAFQMSYNRFNSPSWSFNAGIMVLRPSSSLLDDILSHSLELGTNNNLGDQGLLQKYFFYSCIKDQRLGFLSLPDLKKEFPDHTNTDFLARGGDLDDGINYENYVFVPRMWWHGWVSESTYEVTDWRITNYEHREMSSKKCFQLPRAYHLWVHHDQQALYTDVLIVHFLNSENKPWDWRMGIYGGHYQYWRAFVGHVELLTLVAPLYQTILLFLLPLVFTSTILYLQWRFISWGTSDSRNDFLLKECLRGLNCSRGWMYLAEAVDKILRKCYFSGVVWYGVCALECIGAGVGIRLAVYRFLPIEIHPFAGWLLQFEWTTACSLMVHGFYIVFASTFTRHISPPSPRERTLRGRVAEKWGQVIFFRLLLEVLVLGEMWLLILFGVRWNRVRYRMLWFGPFELVYWWFAILPPCFRLLDLYRSSAGHPYDVL
eukprot:TRINITY_DN4297_c0_g1_i2.p1 TRINITY_DN4297_c0_g1~~TRINITY_DN4297_c0_g1_i2.p1  ORF type:complete len:626 (+),score=85.83 TRINITY_DN4297_c0_g1_i2:153-2030(+)